MRFKAINIRTGASIFKALSEESRIRIIFLMYKNGEMCISDLEHILDFTQTKTSRHLTYLKNAGLLNSNKRDQWVYYQIKEEYMGVITQFMSFLEKDALLTSDQKNYNTLYANNILAIRKIHNQQNRYQLPELR